MKEAETIEIFTPKQVSELLNMQASTLRKYSGLIDKLNGDPYFKRDDLNARIYDKESVDLLKRIGDIKNTPGMTLEKSTKLALKELKESESDSVSSVSGFDISTDTKIATTDISAIQNLFEGIMTQHKQDITDLKEQHKKEMLELMENYKKDSNETKNKLNHLIEQDNQLTKSIEKMQQTLEQPKEKQSFFAKLFKNK